MTGKMAKHMARGLFGGMYGWGKLGGTTKATLYIGSKTGLETGPVPEGKTIPKVKVLETVYGVRAGQIGPAAGGTTTIAEGRYKGIPERSYKVEFFPEEGPAKFRKNIRQLAERLATDLGQREIFVEMVTRGKKTETFTASPTRAPSPLNEAAFCSWVRKNSKSARVDPSDPCYAKRKRGG